MSANEISDFLAVLDAQNEIVISRTRVASTWIATHKALGGAP